MIIKLKEKQSEKSVLFLIFNLFHATDLFLYPLKTLEAFLCF